jgi:predicted outer membrane repeat protein
MSAGCTLSLHSSLFSENDGKSSGGAIWAYGKVTSYYPAAAKKGPMLTAAFSVFKDNTVTAYGKWPPGSVSAA